MLRDVGFCKFKINDKCADACLYGAWSGIRGETGKWNGNIGMPVKLKKILTWHPNFWANLLEGNIYDIYLSFQSRIRKSP